MEELLLQTLPQGWISELAESQEVPLDSNLHAAPSSAKKGLSFSFSPVLRYVSCNASVQPRLAHMLFLHQINGALTEVSPLFASVGASHEISIGPDEPAEWERARAPVEGEGAADGDTVRGGLGLGERAGSDGDLDFDDDVLEQRERDLMEQIRLAELLEEAEEELEKERRAHRAASDGLVAQLRATRVAEERMADAEATLTSYREFVQRDKQAAASFAAATARRHARELDALRRTIDELTSEVEGLQWAKQMAVGVLDLSPERVFEQLLSSRSRAVCDGLAKRLGELITNDDGAEWFASSGWLPRLMRAIEASFGGGGSAEACRALSAVPRCATVMADSDVFVVLDKVLGLHGSFASRTNGSNSSLKRKTSVLERLRDVSNPGEIYEAWSAAVDASDVLDAATAAAAAEAEVASAAAAASAPAGKAAAAIRWCIATTLKNTAVALGVATVSGQDAHTPRTGATAFVAVPRAVALLLRLVSFEAAAVIPDSAVIKLCGNLLSALTSMALTAESVASELTSKGLATLAALVENPVAGSWALKALSDLACSVPLCEAAVHGGVLPSILELLSHSMDPDYSGNPIDTELVAASLSYLAGLSRVEPFSQAFTFLGGHRILVSVLAARLPVGPAAMAAGAEVLVNTLSLADPAAWSEVVPTNVLMPIIEHALPATAPVSVRSRALDVASALLVREPRVAPLFSPQVVAAICALVEEDFATFGYKTIFFLHCYTTSKLWDLAGLAQPAVIRAFVLASNSHHREVHGWLAEVVGEVVSSVLDVWDSDNRVRFTADLQLDLGAVLASVLSRGGGPQTIEAYLGCVMYALKCGDTDVVEALVNRKSVISSEALLLTLPALPSCVKVCTILAELALAQYPKLRSLLLAAGPGLATIAALRAPTSAANVEAADDVANKTINDGERNDRPTRRSRVTVASAALARIAVAVHTPPPATAEAVVALQSSRLIDLLVSASTMDGGEKAASLLSALMAEDIGGFAAAAAASGGVRVIAKQMKSDSRHFNTGAKTVASLLLNDDTASIVLKDAGLGLILNTLRGARDVEVMSVVAEAIPRLFERPELASMALSSSVVSQLLALMDTSPSSLELRTALRVVQQLVRTVRGAELFVRHGGLRVMADTLLYPPGGESDTATGCNGDGTDIDASTALCGLLTDCLSRVLGFGGKLAHAIAGEGGCEALIRLMDCYEGETTEPNDKPAKVGQSLCALGADLELPILHMLNAVAKLPAGAAGVLDGINVVSRFLRRGPAAAAAATAVVVDTAWGAAMAPSHGRTQYQSLALVVSDGGLPALVSAITTPNGGPDSPTPSNGGSAVSDSATEQRRRALWAIATWLNLDDPPAKACFVQAGGLQPLLEVTECDYTPEACRYARLALGKLLAATGDELTVRIEVLRARLSVGNLSPCEDALIATYAPDDSGDGEVCQADPPSGPDDIFLGELREPSYA